MFRSFVYSVLQFAAEVLHLQMVYDWVFGHLMRVVELDVVPDFVLRRGIRLLLAKRKTELAGPVEEQTQRKLAFVAELKNLPVAVQTAAANEQHYEVPTEYFLLCLGRRLKYSSCLYNDPSDDLNTAEQNMLALYCLRAELKDGQDILELGCGWGSLCLFVAKAYSKSRVTAVSNSRTQRELIMARAKQQNITNLQVLTADMVDFSAPDTYDRILSIEMFEHMKNYRTLMARCATWLRPEGKMFVHIFVHRSMPYHFEVKGEDDWMAKYFFSGGTMPSLDLLLYFQEHLAIERQWYVNGTHYSRTLETWLRNQDSHRGEIMPIFRDTYGVDQALKWFVYWRLFYLACSELFHYNGGEEWGVGHYLFVKPAAPQQGSEAAAAGDVMAAGTAKSKTAKRAAAAAGPAQQ